MSGNTVTLVGNLTRDPELRFTPNGKAVAKFGIAYNHSYLKGEERVEEVNYFDGEAWGTLAENIAESLSKGSRVLLEGRLKYDSWETDEGDKRSKVQVVVDAIGPDLRWATVAVSRNERDGGGKPPAQAKKSPAPTSDWDNEEPFVVDAGEWWPTVGYGSYPKRLLP